MTYAERDLIDTIDRLVSDGSTEEATPEALQYLDQYHAGGPQAVERLLGTMALSPSDRVLDVGSGLGGPARQVAATSGCQVTGGTPPRPTSRPPPSSPIVAGCRTASASSTATSPTSSPVIRSTPGSRCTSR